ncbi:VanZ family protein [Polaribacter uvawellassae]|uniref:VanZ family protein n=1 Tax=Polaribacter uvawellassae TaxID=3133495 RepID=UPI003219D620
MRKLIKILLKDKIIFIAIFIALVIGFLSLIKSTGPTINLSNVDKIYHTIAYFILSLTWLLSFPISRKNNTTKYAIALGCVFYGIIIEVLQTTLTTYRTASLLDVVANSVGVFIALLIFNSIYKKIDAI